MADVNRGNRPLSPFMIGPYYRPQLTSITHPGRDLARRATRMVLDQLAGQPAPPPIIITPVLVERASG